MAEQTAKRSLPIAKDVVKVDAPKPGAQQSTAANAAAARAEQMSVAAKKNDKEPAKPAFQPNAEKATHLTGLQDDTLIRRAKEAGLLRDVDAADRRIFQATGNRIDKTKGQPVERSKMRHAILTFIENRTVEHGGKTLEKAAEGRVIHAYALLAGTEVTGGKYDSGYLGTRRGENKSRGMIARGFIDIVGDNTPGEGKADGESPATEQQAAIEAGHKTPQEEGRDNSAADQSGADETKS